jgi:hypothetical protein
LGGLGGQILACVEEEFAELENRHTATPPTDFNRDEVYQRLTTEAIEAKTLCLRKIRICASQAGKGAGQDTMDLFLKLPIKDFASQYVEFEVATGLFNFPWAEVVNMSRTVPFGRWRPQGIDEGKLRVVLEALAKNTNMRLVTLDDDCGKLHSLALLEGWASKSLEWGIQDVVHQAPALAALLIRNCVHLETLELR